ncbi:MAG: agmatine deiminase [Steroidobacter sp.]
MTQTLATTPAADGFHMPGEFESHSGCWMLWPERPTNWRLGAKPAQAAFAAVATAIATGEPVTVGASRAQFVHARTMLPDAIRVVELSSDDAWMRDVGPTFVVNRQREVRGVDWIFNAWGGLGGGLYFPWDQDDLVARKVLETEGRARYRAPLVMEGGAFHVDGEGTLITTEESLLNPNRNPQLDRGQLEILLHEYLGVTSVIWLGKGVIDDETSGHTDNLCCFARPGEVVLTWTDNKRDPQYKVSLDAHERLMGARDAQGRRLKIHKLQQPGPLFRTREESQNVDAVEGVAPRRTGERLAASYVNFYMANSTIVMPLLDPKRDRDAAKALQEIFPERRIIGVQAREILLGGGNIHCITQQVPDGKRIAVGGQRTARNGKRNGKRTARQQRSRRR